MRVFGLALLSGVVLLGACGGGESQNAAPEATPAAAPAAEPTGAVTMAPITGTMHEVHMVGDATGYRYEPSTIDAKPGDGIKFIMISGGPHNVGFDPAAIPADMKAQLWANMGPNSMDGQSPMLITDNEEFVLSLGNLKPGKYPFFCTPHLAMNMKGEINIQ
jgi:plastocyanin